MFSKWDRVKVKTNSIKGNWKNHLYGGYQQDTFNKQYFREEITRVEILQDNENENTFHNPVILLKEINNSIKKERSQINNLILHVKKQIKSSKLTRVQQKTVIKYQSDYK